MRTEAVVREGRMALSCHHRGISRMKAEELLIDRKEDGSFLVRDSETIPNAYTLCVLYQESVKHYRILPDTEGLLYIQSEKGQERKYADLLQLIHELVQRADHSLLTCPLRHPVPVDVDDDERDSDDDELDGSSAHVPGGVRSDRANVEMISTYFSNRLSTLDMSIHDSEFISKLRDYADERVHRDIIDASAGSEQMSELQQIIAESARELNKHVTIFLSKIDTCKQLFGYASSPSPAKKNENPKEKGRVDLPVLLDKCAQCKTSFNLLEKKALKTLQELKTKEWEVDSSGSIQSCRVNSKPDGPETGRKKAQRGFVPPTSFKARLQRHGKSIKMTLMVDMQAGKFFAVKDSQSQNSLDDTNTFFHDKIEQVIKYSTNTSRLDLLIAGRKKETYQFEDLWNRDTFCQMIQELKMFHASSKQVDHLSVFIGTWNMGSEVPPPSLATWLKSQGQGKERSRAVGLIPHDMYVIGTQESALTEKDWVNRLKASLQETMAYEVHDMHTVVTVSMWSLRMVVLVRADFKNKISHVQHANVKTGIANKLGNKGAIGVSFQFEETTFCFVNCHLTSGHERNAKRNQNVHDIITGLSLGKKQPMFDITNQFHHLFFLGDLNYRMEDMDALTIIKQVTQERDRNTNQYSELLQHDQLHRSQAKAEVFFSFNEEDITFPPSYRFERGSVNKYSWQKFKKTGTRINVPSWCDRVIYKSYPDTYIKNTSYGMVEEVKTSDHKPVFSSFDVEIISPTASHGKVSRNARIQFEQIMAEVHTTTKDRFRISFYSKCIEGEAESEQNDSFLPSTSHMKHKHVCPSWSQHVLPLIMPVFDDRDYLEDQHILLAVKASDGLELYGECVIALKPMFSVKPEPFEAFLMHRGERTGHIKGLMHIGMTNSTNSGGVRRRKSYELVCMDTDIPRIVSHVSVPPTLDESEETLYEHTAPPAARVHEQAAMRMRPAVTLRHGPSAAYARANRQRKTATETPPEALTHDFRVKLQATPEVKTRASAVPMRGPGVLPRMRTKLGQSSLAAPSVLPAARATSATGSNNNNTTTPSRATSALWDENANTRRSAIGPGDNDYSSLPANLSDQRAHAFDLSTSASSAPPRVMPRRKPPPGGTTDPDSYDKLRRPGGISEWLLDLGLPEYIRNFNDSGWDQLDYMDSITDTDLVAMRIHIAEHRQRVLRSVRDMKPQ